MTLTPEMLLRILIGWTVVSCVTAAGWSVIVTGFRQAERRPDHDLAELEHSRPAKTRRNAA